MRGGIGLFVVAAVLAYGGALVVLGVGLYVATMVLTRGMAVVGSWHGATGCD